MWKQDISLEKLDPQDVRLFLLQITDKPPTPTDGKIHQNSTPLQPLTDANEAQSNANKKALKKK